MDVKKSRHNDKVSISVLTSLYRCEKHLKNYFSHVSEIVNLDQIELIFIHNDPTEKEKSIIFNALQNNEHINFQYIEVPREGLYKSWNRGVNIAQGEFVAVWNVDDIRYPKSLKVQDEALKKNPEAGFVYGNRHKSYLGNTNKIEIKITKDISLSSWNITFQDGAFIMWRKRILIDVGLFDEQFKIAGDADMWYRVASNYDVIKIDETLGLFYKHNEALSSNGSSGESFIVGMRYGFFKQSQFRNAKMGLNSIKLSLIINNWSEKKIRVLCYNSIFTYLYSLKNLLKFIKSEFKTVK